MNADPLRRPDPTDSDGPRDLRFFPADPDHARSLSRAQIDGYNRNGFVPQLDLLASDEADLLRRYVDDLLTAVIDADDRRNAYSINSYHMVCRGLWDLVNDPRIVAYVTDILGPDVVCWGSHLFAKYPGDPKAVPIHQDAVYWPLTPSKTVTVWLAIDDADESNAAIQFVPGSHRHGALEHEELGLDGTRVLGRQVVGADSYGERHLNQLRAGQMSLHSDLLLHGSGVNRSDRRRAGLTLRYAAASVDLIPGYDHWRTASVHVAGSVDRDRWGHRRRPDGEHPEKMADFWGDFDGQPLDAG